MKGGSIDSFAAGYPEADRGTVLRIMVGNYAEDTDHPWHRLERGEITYAEWKEQNLRDLSAAGFAPAQPAGNPDGPPLQKSEPDIDWGPNRAMVELIEGCRAAGLATALLTNNVREFRPMWWPALPFEELFDTIVDSSFVGMRKPNPAIYHFTLEQLGGRDGSRAVFLDDALSNVEAARRIGWHGVHVVGTGADAIATVRGLTAI
jgi:epoxide hydrolase-like predicted phosphatase